MTEIDISFWKTAAELWSQPVGAVEAAAAALLGDGIFLKQDAGSRHLWDDNDIESEDIEDEIEFLFSKRED